MVAKRRRLYLVLAVAAVTAVATWAALSTSVPEVSPAAADELAATADDWCVRSPDRVVPTDEWPEAVRRLRPNQVRVTADGVYLRRGSWFVEEWGVFVLRSGASLQTSDPSYRPLRGRVYWYEVKG